MINSAAFPNVAFNNPPRPSPTRKASSSVARPIQPATGMMARAEQTKSAVGFEKAGTNRRTRATGTNTSSQLSDGFQFTISSWDSNCFRAFRRGRQYLGGSFGQHISGAETQSLPKRSRHLPFNS